MLFWRFVTSVAHALDGDQSFWRAFLIQRMENTHLKELIMEALVYRGPGKKELENRLKPEDVGRMRRTPSSAF